MILINDFSGKFKISLEFQSVGKLSLSTYWFYW